jgi:hypothetical protein
MIPDRPNQLHSVPVLIASKDQQSAIDVLAARPLSLLVINR